jgi:hypothetical protein
VPIVFQKFIHRRNLREFPNCRYVFGDNVRRAGFGGQATEMRGEPNAIGVVTKWAPSMSRTAFFDDTLECKELVLKDLMRVQEALDEGRTVVVPSDGIGTGLSRLPDLAPNLDRFIKNWFKERT